MAAGRTDDLSGRALAEHARQAGAEILQQRVVSDERTAISGALRELVAAGAEVILTTGGTGLTPDDVTPEATLDVVDRLAPGYAEAMRAEALRHTPMGILSRGVSGIAGRTLIVNFPGNPKAIDELFGVVAPTLPHAVATLNRQGGRSAGDVPHGHSSAADPQGQVPHGHSSAADPPGHVPHGHSSAADPPGAAH